MVVHSPQEPQEEEEAAIVSETRSRAVLLLKKGSSWNCTSFEGCRSGVRCFEEPLWCSLKNRSGVRWRTALVFAAATWRTVLVFAFLLWKKEPLLLFLLLVSEEHGVFQNNRKRRSGSSKQRTPKKSGSSANARTAGLPLAVLGVLREANTRTAGLPLAAALKKKKRCVSEEPQKIRRTALVFCCSGVRS